MNRLTPRHRRILVAYGVLSAAGLVIFNLFGGVPAHAEVVPVNPWFIMPFGLLLAAIAVMPFIHRRWWEEYYPAVACALGLVVVLYYGFGLHNASRMFLSGSEYVSFLSLIGSLFVVSGGIHIRMRGAATPLGNVGMLLTGAVLANILGTTGASMVLIRPFLRMNRGRVRAYHVVFFIFVVSNIGGALTPIGDPPLFLGYLKGVPFFWVLTRAVSIWALTIGLVLLVFAVLDTIAYRQHRRRMHHAPPQLEDPEVAGLHNIIYLIIILGAVFIQSPAPQMLRETIMWGAAIASYLTTKREVHEKNGFELMPIKEVAILFAGIFATMVPALDWLELNASQIGITQPGQYYWGTGVLSALLDNAPTYLNFLSAAFGLHGASIEHLPHVQAVLGLATPAALGLTNPLQTGAQAISAATADYVLAISVGAVFFGAMTYIGNGPNFMVKSIAERAGADCPSFFGYILRYSAPVLLPIFTLVWWIYFHS